MKRAGRMMPTFTGTAKRITFEQYCAALRQQGLAAQKIDCTLFGACELASKINSSDVMTDGGENIFALPSLIMAAKILTEPRYPLIPTANSQFESCLNAARHFYPPTDGIDFDFHFLERDPTHEEMLRLYVWFMSSNHQYQGDMAHEVANTLILTGISDFKSLPKSSGQVDALFNHFVQVDAKDYFMTLFALWGASLKNFYFNTSTFLLTSAKKSSLQKSLRDITNSLSFKSSEPLTSNKFKHASAYTGKAKSEAILSLRPLIQVQDEIFFFAGHPFLKIQCSRKFLPKALFYARSLNSGNPMTAFSQFVGEQRLEPFFKELCNIWQPPQGHHDEYFWDRPNGSKSADRIVFEKHGNNDVATLFQLKNKTMVEASIFGSSFDALKKDIQSAFAEMIYKSISFLWAAYNARKNNQLNPSTKHITEKILDSKFCLLIGISPDVAPIFTSQPLREILIEKVRAEAGEDAWNWIQSHYEKVYWHILSLHEFEAFLCIPKVQQDFHKTISHYFRDSRLEHDPISFASGLPASYRSYIINRYGTKTERGRRITMLPELEEIFGTFQGEMKTYFDLKK